MAASEDINNFGRVDGRLLRGAQPDEKGIASLARLGVRTVINLRPPYEAWMGEEAVVRSYGIGYVNVPLREFSAPTDAQVAQVLTLIENSSAPVFVHCQHGADRAGTIIACYRMRHDGWAVDRAFAEAKRHGFSPFEIGMRRYIFAFSPANLP